MAETAAAVVAPELVKELGASHESDSHLVKEDHQPAKRRRKLAGKAIDEGSFRELAGQVCRKRAMSSRFYFIDIICTGGEEDGELHEIVLKTQDLEPRSPLVEVKSLFKSCALGDQIRVTVIPLKREQREWLLLTPITVTRSWSSTGSVKPYVFAGLPVDFFPGRAPGQDALANDTRALCKFYTSSGTCLRGEQCRFRHTDDKVERQRWMWERAQLRRRRQTLRGDTTDLASKAPKRQRGQVFVDWLVSKFGASRLGSGTGVIDVAGGRGDVSFELTTKRGIPSTIIDPRPRRLNKLQRRWLKKSGFQWMSVEEINTLEMDSARRRKLDSLPAPRMCNQHLELFGTDFEAEQAEYISRSSILIGMHPDQATEYIVDVAIRHQKPFAVVPCCVFPLDGASLSFEEWCEHLMRKSPVIKSSFLPVVGKNRVLYYDPINESSAGSKHKG